MKIDGEYSINALEGPAKKTQNSSGFNAGVAVSPVGGSEANGEIERAIKTVHGQVRTLESALDEHYRIALREDHALMPWLVSHSSC